MVPGIVYNTVVRVVLDTNVLVAAIRSSTGASHSLLRQVGTGVFEIAISVPLVLEYEDVLHRHLEDSPLSKADVGTLLDYVCKVGIKQEIFFLWRPVLRDPKDDMVLELAVAARSDSIVTFNVSDFDEAEKFGLSVYAPRQFLEQIGDSP